MHTALAGVTARMLACMRSQYPIRDPRTREEVGVEVGALQGVHGRVCGRQRARQVVGVERQRGQAAQRRPLRRQGALRRGASGSGFSV